MTPCRLSRLLAGLGVVIVLAAGCGSSGLSPAAKAQQEAFLAEVHDQVPTIGQLRSDRQLVELGHATCSDFASGASYPALAERMALQDGNLPTSVLGTVITAAGENLCPKYSSMVT